MRAKYTSEWREYRCERCKHLLFRSPGGAGRIETTCQDRRCRHRQIRWLEAPLDTGKEQKLRSLREAEAADREERWQTLLSDPSDFMRVMEEKWRAAAVIRAKERTEMAVGLRWDVLSRDAFRCQYCGVSVDDGAVLHVDHRIPRSRGGLTTMENLVTACLDCNLGKSDKDLTVA